jgi:hypothetical protein
MAKYFSLDSYKELWNLEVVAGRNFRPLAIVVRNWSAVRKAFEARNRLAHGRDRYTKNMATPNVEVLLRGASYIDDIARAWAILCLAECRSDADPVRFSRNLVLMQELTRQARSGVRAKAQSHLRAGCGTSAKAALMRRAALLQLRRRI